MIDGIKSSGERKIHFKIELSLICNEERLDDSKSNDKETMIGVDIEEIIRKVFDSLSYKYQVALEQPMKSSDFFFFMFYYVDRLFYKCHKIRITRVDHK